MEEPSDEILSQLMEEVAEDAKHKGEEAERRFFDGLAARAKEELQDWNRRCDNSSVSHELWRVGEAI